MIDRIKHNGTEYKITEEDSGWIPATLTQYFARSYHYTEDKNMPRYRKCGNVVEINGIVSPTQSWNTSGEKELFYLPEGFRPDRIRWFIVHCDSTKHCQLLIRETGRVSIARYSSEDMNIGTESQIMLQVTFLID